MHTIQFKHIKYLLPVLLSLFLVSCNVINPDEPVPAYIKIDHISLTTDQVSEGSASQKITDAWVYIDGSLIGTFELPAKFPVLKEGMHDLTIMPGIKVNGITNTRAYYPFYKPYELKINLVKGEVLEVYPEVTYYPGKVNWVEDFEAGGLTIETPSSDDTSMTKTSDPIQVFEGDFSGMVQLNSTKNHFLGVTTGEYTFPLSSAPVFLEMNYKSNCVIYIGLYALYNGNTTRYETMLLNEMPEWNKIYINLTTTVQQQVNATSWKLLFEIAKPDSLSNGWAYFDNLKLVYTKP